MMTFDNDWGITDLLDATPPALMLFLIAETQGCANPGLHDGTPA